MNRWLTVLLVLAACDDKSKPADDSSLVESVPADDSPTDSPDDSVDDSSADSADDSADDSPVDTGPFDEDGDGVPAALDCDDSDAERGAATPWYADRDSDAFGDPNQSTMACEAPSGFVADNTDCDDDNLTIFPGAAEICDGVDDDCDGLIDAEDGSLIDGLTGFIDGDGDGYGDTPDQSIVCELPSGVVSVDGDCDDGDAGIFPGAVELCDEIDNDCDGLVDDLDADLVPNATWYLDLDQDGYGSNASTVDACLAPSGYCDNPDDCDDTDPAVYPGAPERPNGADDDCNGTTDAGTSAYDDDGDGQTEQGGDCNDTDASIYTGATEICDDGVDQDCDGDDPPCDDDGDGYTEDDNDCDDSDPNVYPGAVELPNGVDDDCDGTTDEGTDAYDDDGDGQSEQGGDCNDTDASIYTGATEICDDGIDQDCNGSDTPCDDDGDGYNEDDGDCDDGDPAVNPGAAEVYNGIDDDCDGTVDNGAYPNDCAEILAVNPGSSTGSYTIDPGGAGNPFAVNCQMTMDGGGWTRAIPAYLATLSSANSREYLYSYGSAWYKSPTTTMVWSWSTYQPLNGTYSYSTGSTTATGTFGCTHAEAGSWGVGCSNGGGGTYKVLPIYNSNSSTGNSTVCQDRPDVFGVGACRTNAEIWVRDL